MAHSRIGLRHMEQETVAIPVSVTKEDEAASLQHRVEEGVEALGAGAVGAERKGMLATHELELAPKLQNVVWALSEYRRTDADQVIVLQLKRTSFSHLR